MATKKHHTRIPLFDQIKMYVPLTDQERALQKIIAEGQVLKKNPINHIRLCGGIIKILPLLDKVLSRPSVPPKEFFSFLNHRDPKKQQALEKLIQHLIHTLPDYRKLFDPIELLTLLTFPPQLFEIMEDVDQLIVQVRKEVDLRRWRNTLRYLKADDCPLEEEQRNAAVLNYELAIGFRRDIIRSKWGIKTKPGQVWRRIIKDVINYLNPFFVSRRQQERKYVRDNPLTVTADTLQAVARLMFLSYPAFFPKADTAKIKRLYYSK